MSIFLWRRANAYFKIFRGLHLEYVIIIYASMWENQTLFGANSKGAIQSAHLYILISAFVIPYLEKTEAELAASSIF